MDVAMNVPVFEEMLREHGVWVGISLVPSYLIGINHCFLLF